MDGKTVSASNACRGRRKADLDNITGSEVPLVPVILRSKDTSPEKVDRLEEQHADAPATTPPELADHRPGMGTWVLARLPGGESASDPSLVHLPEGRLPRPRPWGRSPLAPDHVSASSPRSPAESKNDALNHTSSHTAATHVRILGYRERPAKVAGRSFPEEDVAENCSRRTERAREHHADMPQALQGLWNTPRAPGGGHPWWGQAGEGAGLRTSQRGPRGSQCLGCHQASQNWLSRCVKTVIALPEQLLKALSYGFKVSHIGVDLDPQGGAGLRGVGQGTCQTDGDSPGTDLQQGMLAEKGRRRAWIAVAVSNTHVSDTDCNVSMDRGRVHKDKLTVNGKPFKAQQLIMGQDRQPAEPSVPLSSVQSKGEPVPNAEIDSLTNAEAI
ncbi:MAG: hypothetical protein FRX49_11810 [Trebouxia sp. A1-2]|nr:MAG: hypothetical protein FRX49_11810 [Trebouxia sp. A1-2]